ncbi:type IV secretion system protein [Aliarcobacter cryaerophilus]|uniref:type IV secretion system protein n=1 Tax=Aliarcobacter cryaerophilus TaxID=28198 RepID=UPI0021B475DA|nr:type IV secretion system protein [Aliarcobacter cryaerophilus]MCT7513403.1 type IV secretion system protein [Aliarcobacter cryaerophilus]
MNFFQGLGAFVSSIFNFLNSSDIQTIIQALASLFGITVTLWVMLEAYKSFAGKSDRPIQELVWKIVSAMLIISVATNQNGFMETLKVAFEQLHHLMSGDINLFAKLDKLFDEAIKLANLTYQATPSGFSPSGFGGAILGALCMLLIYLGFVIGAVPAFLIIVFTELTLKLLLLLLPIAVFALAFGFSKQIFNQWLNLFISNALTILIVGLIMSAVLETYTDFQTSLISNVGNVEPMGIALQSFIMGIIMLGLVKVAHSIAEKLGTVSIEAISKSALGSQISGSASNTAKVGSSASVVTGATKQGAKQMYSDTKGYIQNARTFQPKNPATI